MNFKKLSTGAAVVLSMALLSSPAANANVILTYTGHDFNSFTPTLGSPGQPYTGTDIVTASILLANPLGDNLNLTSVTPLAFSFFDGVQRITNITENISSGMFEFTTDAIGQITGWNLGIQHFNDSIKTSVGVDMGAITTILAAAQAEVDGDPGVWTSTSAAVPEPPTVSVLGAGLLGLDLLWCGRNSTSLSKPPNPDRHQRIQRAT